MRLKLYWAFCLVLLFSIGAAVEKDHNTTNLITPSSNKQNITNDKLNNDRTKRSLEGGKIPFWPNRGRRLSDLENNDKPPNDDRMEKEPPFWGTRGRRDDSGSFENIIDDSPLLSDDAIFTTKCKHCYATPLIDNYDDNNFSKELQDVQVVPFWGNRGRRDSREDEDKNHPFWGNRGRRQEEDLFWGNRGRRQEDEPFWGARGRREDELPFWGTRGRRHSWEKQNVMPEESSVWGKRNEEEPFWGNRGRRIEAEPFWGNRGRRDEVEPFWGNRGRRDEVDPFWGNRGRRDEEVPFWGNRGRRDEDDPFWGTRGRRGSKNIHKENLKEILSDAISSVEDNIDSLARTRRHGNHAISSWVNRGRRESKLSHSFRLDPKRFQSRGLDSKHSDSRTVLDDRMFAEEPHYILVERSSRSSSEDDPFFISRGKKMFIARIEYPYSARERRGSLEDIVKSVRNDPYYIARGKKNRQYNATSNSSSLPEELDKAKELICATIDLLLYNKGSEIKREMENNNDRDRRTILKKLAVQLQRDPYFASRGKKNESGFNEDNLKDFIKEVSVKCN